MDINDAIKNKIDSVVDEKLDSMIEKRVESMLEDILKDLFSSWGDLNKKVKEAVSSKINVNLESLNLVDYNAMIAKAISDNFNKELNEKPIIDMVSSMIGKVDYDSIELSDLVYKVTEIAKSENYDGSIDGEIYFDLEDDEEKKWVSLKIGLEKDYEDDHVEVLIHERKDKNVIFSMKVNHYTKQIEAGTPESMTIHSRLLENLFFQLYNNRVNIIFDDYDPDTTWSRMN